jgi:hypothetical protein
MDSSFVFFIWFDLAVVVILAFLLAGNKLNSVLSLFRTRLLVNSMNLDRDRENKQSSSNKEDDAAAGVIRPKTESSNQTFGEDNQRDPAGYPDGQERLILGKEEETSLFRRIRMMLDEFQYRISQEKTSSEIRFAALNNSLDRLFVSLEKRNDPEVPLRIESVLLRVADRLESFEKALDKFELWISNRINLAERRISSGIRDGNRENRDADVNLLYQIANRIGSDVGGKLSDFGRNIPAFSAEFRSLLNAGREQVAHLTGVRDRMSRIADRFQGFDLESTAHRQKIEGILHDLKLNLEWQPFSPVDNKLGEVLIRIEDIFAGLVRLESILDRITNADSSDADFRFALDAISRILEKKGGRDV